VADPRATALEDLLGWRAEQGGDPCDARGIADWLWLQANMEGCALPQRFVVRGERGLGSGGDRGGLPLERPSIDPVITDDRGSDSATELDKPPPDPFAPTVFPDPPPDLGEKSSPTAGLFSEAQLPDDGDVRERLKRRKGFVPLLLRQEPMLQRPLALLAALRPLLQKQPHPYRRVLDEGLTAERSADLGRPWPVLRPRLAAGLEVDLWLDAGVAMSVWQPLAEELQHVLASSQALTRVTLRQFQLEQLDGPTASSSSAKQPAEAAVVTLLLSDTAGRHWWDGSMARWLEAIANQQPLAVLHTLPLRYRVRTALRRGVAVTLSNRRWLGPNCGYQAVSVASLDPRRWQVAARLQLPEGLKLPVLSLNPRDLAPWGALVMGDTLARTGGAVLPVADSRQESPPPSQPPRPVDDVGAEAESLWLEFRQQASPEAQRLMLLMAAAPLLTLPVLRLLMAAELPDLADPLPLAEVLVSGLVCRREGQAGASPDAVQFELLPAVQELLEPQLEPRARVAVIQAITDLLERRLARHGRGPTFETLLSDPKAAARGDAAGLAHFANLTAAMLDRLPGQPFREIARQLRAAGGSGPMPLWPATMAFEDHAFSTAQLVDTPDLEPEAFSTARWHEVELLQVLYPTLRPADLAAFLRQVKKEGGAAARASLPTATAWAFFEPLQRDALLPGATAAAAAPLCLTLVEIPAGSFLMGSPPEELWSSGREGPQHEVKLESFFISQTPITQAQWREVAGWQPLPAERWRQDLNPDPSHFQNREGQAEGEVRLFEAETNTDNRPVEQVSWLDALEFCHRLSQRTGRTYTLPSEAQWEYACRAGTTTPFYFGATLSPELANYNGNYAYADGPQGIDREQTTPVGMFAANAWGLHDMHGNVWEWCLDHWLDNSNQGYEGAPADGSPWLSITDQQDQLFTKAENNGTNDLERRLLRGGSWSSDPGGCRSACRPCFGPGDADDGYVGFRVVCLPQGPSLNP